MKNASGLWCGMRRADRVLVVFVLLLLTSSAARAADQGAAGWIGVKLRVPFAERYSFQLMTEPRLFQNPDQLRALLIRPWFDVTLPHGFGVALGYDGLLFSNPIIKQEHRLWQQVSHGHGWEHVRTLLRFRLEQRFFSQAERVSVRGRFLLGVAVPLGLGIDFLVNNEFFVNFNDLPVVGAQGYTENRLYGGFGRRFAPWVAVAIGYQMQWQDLDLANLINHTVMVGAAFETPARKPRFRRRPVRYR
jgi:hypothetical protein